MSYMTQHWRGTSQTSCVTFCLPQTRPKCRRASGHAGASTLCRPGLLALCTPILLCQGLRVQKLKKPTGPQYGKQERREAHQTSKPQAKPGAYATSCNVLWLQSKPWQAGPPYPPHICLLPCPIRAQVGRTHEDRPALHRNHSRGRKRIQA